MLALPLGMTDVDEPISILGPLFILISQQRCWKCNDSLEVIAMATSQLSEQDMFCSDADPEKDLILFSEIEQMPDAVQIYLQARYPRFCKRFSNTLGSEYFANSCVCGALQGDHYLHSQPGGAFFPQSDEEASKIRLITLPFSPPMAIRCSYHIGSVGEVILAHCQRAARDG
jgi:hypothetical protein